MIQITDKSRCSGCSACAQICPRSCIRMEADREGFLYPVVDQDRCSRCGLCERICPVSHPVQTQKGTQALAVYSKDGEIRRRSSSGGVFFLLAQAILEQGGVVFGAAFDKNCRVVHTAAQTPAELARLRGSKYVQSEVGNAYIRAKQFLEQGRPVLFTGTPCQTAGLRAYLGKNFPGLLCVDFICHGAPSPAVWEEYLRLREQQASAAAQKVSFRDKTNGWEDYSIVIQFENGTEYRCPYREDVYMKAFLHNLILRPACQACAFKGESRCSDLTLADFWGIREVAPDMDDGMGVSLVWAHTQQGEDWLKRLQSQTVFHAVELAQALAFNASATQSSQPHPGRRRFFARLGKQPLDRLAERCLKDGLLLRLKKWAYRRLKGV